MTKHNAVVNERSSQDCIDLNAQHNVALRTLVDKLNGGQRSTEHLQTERIDV